MNQRLSAIFSILNVLTCLCFGDTGAARILVTNKNDSAFIPIETDSDEILTYLDDTVFSAMYMFNHMPGSLEMDISHFIHTENEWVFDIIFETIKCKPNLNETFISTKCMEIIKKLSKINQAQWKIFDKTCQVLGLFGTHTNSECFLWKYMTKHFIRTPDELSIVFLHDSRSTIDGLRETDYCVSWKCSFRTFVGEILIDDIHSGVHHIGSMQKIIMLELKKIPILLETNYQSVIANRLYQPKEKY